MTEGRNWIDRVSPYISTVATFFIALASVGLFCVSCLEYKILEETQLAANSAKSAAESLEATKIAIQKLPDQIENLPTILATMGKEIESARGLNREAKLWRRDIQQRLDKMQPVLMKLEIMDQPNSNDIPDMQDK